MHWFDKLAESASKVGAAVKDTGAKIVTSVKATAQQVVTTTQAAMSQAKEVVADTRDAAKLSLVAAYEKAQALGSHAAKATNDAFRAAAGAFAKGPAGTPIATCPAPNLWDTDKKAGGATGASVLFLQTSGTATGRGLVGTVSAEASAGMVRMSNAGYLIGNWLGGSHKLDLMTVEAKGRAGADYGLGGSASIDGQMASEEGSLFLGDNENNPWIEVGADYKLMHGEAEATAFVGSDGRRVGPGKVKADAGFKAAETGLRGEINIPLGGWTLSLSSRASASWAAADAEVSGHAFRDSETGRYHSGGSLGAALGIGGELEFDFSVGPPYKTRDRDK